MSINKFGYIFCLLSTVFLSTAQATDHGVAANGQKLSQKCVACHSADGNSVVGTWPKLAGQHQQYIELQLHDFKKGQKGGRYDPSMEPMVADLSAQDIADLAAYFSSQQTSPGVADKSLVEKGQALYRGGDSKKGISACIACHGPSGLGNSSAGFPKLSNQHAQYVMKQLQDYRAGTRANGKNDIMTMIAKHMTDEDIQAVASYVSGLH